jgi:hypothetical protein
MSFEFVKLKKVKMQKYFFAFGPNAIVSFSARKFGLKPAICWEIRGKVPYHEALKTMMRCR